MKNIALNNRNIAWKDTILLQNTTEKQNENEAEEK
jgi:hypothetical protein